MNTIAIAVKNGTFQLQYVVHDGKIKPIIYPLSEWVGRDEIRKIRIDF